jgi:hypothetical protein
MNSTQAPETLINSLGHPSCVPWEDEDEEEEEEHFLDRLITRRLGGQQEAQLKLLKWFWLIGLLMMMAGYVIMILMIVGRSPFE